MKTLLFFASVLVVLSATVAAHASTGTVTAKVLRVTVIDNADTGGCLVQLSRNLSGAPDCDPVWVTLSCDGAYSKKDLAFWKLEQAHLAFAMNTNVFVAVDSTRKMGGRFCYAYRFDIMN